MTEGGKGVYGNLREILRKPPMAARYNHHFSVTPKPLVTPRRVQLIVACTIIQ